MVAHRCQSQKIKITKIKKKNKIKNQNEKNEIIKKYYSEKNPTKLTWPMSTKYDKKFFYSKGKKTQN